MRAIVPALLAALLTVFSAGPELAQNSIAGQPVMPVPGTPRPMGVYPSQAQGQFLGGVTQGSVTPGELTLSLDDAIQRGLKNNLGTLVGDQDRRRSQAARLKTLADLLPNLSMRAQTSEQQLNLAAFGFSNFPGIAPIVGPFGLVDLRGYLTQRVLDIQSIRNTQASGQMVKATEQSFQNSRDTVVLVVGGLYLQALAGESRVKSEQTQVDTAEAVYRQAVDYKSSGLIPAIDVLRAQVELEADRQRLVSAQSDFDKMKLSLAQAIGLPLEQQIRLSDQLSPETAPAVTLDQALDRAYDNRSDYRSAQSLVKAAQFSRRAAVAERYPSVAATVDYGTIGQSVTQNHGTFTAAIGLNIPIYEGGRTEARITDADAVLRQREAERDALRSQIEFEVRTVFLDLKSTLDQVKLASNARSLADTQVAQARDRFAAGVATSLEVVQAQQALAVASDNYISSLFNYNLAKGSLARTAGQAEKLFRLFVLGDK